jgi:hypothetical protein
MIIPLVASSTTPIKPQGGDKSTIHNAGSSSRINVFLEKTINILPLAVIRLATAGLAVYSLQKKLM